MALLGLPNELLLAVADVIDEPSSLNALARTNRRLYRLLNSTLYSHDARTHSAFALHWAATHGMERTARLSLAEGARVDAMMGTERIEQQLGRVLAITLETSPTPLQVAIGYRHEKIACLLAQHGADVRRVYPYPFAKFKPLHVASSLGLVDTVRMLLQKGARLEARDKYGQTALHYAAKPMEWRLKSHRHVEVVELLIKSGAALTVRDVNGRTPASLVSEDVRPHNEGQDEIEASQDTWCPAFALLVPLEEDCMERRNLNLSVDKDMRRLFEAGMAVSAVQRLEKDRAKKHGTKRLQEKASLDRAQKDCDSHDKQRRDEAARKAGGKNGERQSAEETTPARTKKEGGREEAESASMPATCEMERQMEFRMKGGSWRRVPV